MAAGVERDLEVLASWSLRMSLPVSCVGLTRASRHFGKTWIVMRLDGRVKPGHDA